LTKQRKCVTLSIQAKKLYRLLRLLRFTIKVIIYNKDNNNYIFKDHISYIGFTGYRDLIGHRALFSLLRATCSEGFRGLARAFKSLLAIQTLPPVLKVTAAL